MDLGLRDKVVNLYEGPTLFEWLGLSPNLENERFSHSILDLQSVGSSPLSQISTQSNPGPLNYLHNFERSDSHIINKVTRKRLRKEISEFGQNIH